MEGTVLVNEGTTSNTEDVGMVGRVIAEADEESEQNELKQAEAAHEMAGKAIRDASDAIEAACV